MSIRGSRRVTALICAALLFAALSPLDPVVAKTPLKCDKHKLQDKTFRMCSGLVRSRDGSVMLDADLTLPAKGDGPFPLIVMLHGLGGSKDSHEVLFEDEAGFDPEVDSIEGSGGNYRYNNAWFASRGYAVLNYTARGFHADACLDDSVQASDSSSDFPDSPACQIQLFHKDHEIKDFQYLVGSLVDGTLGAGVKIDRKHIGVTGISYGGAQTWMLTRDSRWRSQEGKRIAIKVAAPLIGGTDLLDALLPNGTPHANLMPPATIAERLAEKPGVLKEAYIKRFYLGLQLTANVQGDLPDYIDGWYDRVLEGEPYTDALSATAFDSFLRNRSAYYMPSEGTVPIVAVQGWTDHIFPAVQSLQMFNSLRAGDPEYPIKVLLNDFGHPVAQNPEDVIVYQAYLINEWLDHYLRGKGVQPSAGVESFDTVCPESGDTGASNYLASNFEGLTSETVEIGFPLEGTLETAVVDPAASALDPFPVSTPEGCRDTSIQLSTGNLGASVPWETGMQMLGIPTVTFQADPSAADMYVAFRLWDVTATRQILVDRGVVRLGSDQPQTVVAQLQGNSYEFLAGHDMKLELVAKDSPSFSAPSATGTVDISDVVLSFPTANPAAQAQGR